MHRGDAKEDEDKKVVSLPSDSQVIRNYYADNCGSKTRDYNRMVKQVCTSQIYMDAI
jgi:hypothetical protein